MKKRLRLINLFAIVLAFTTFSCNNDDEVINNEITIQDFTATIDENPTSGLSLGTVQADGNGTLSFSITSQTPSGALTINTNSGEVSVADAALFDFETNQIITATIAVAGAENTATVTINLNDLDEIGVQDLTVAIDENPTNGQVVGTVQVDGNGPFSFSIDSQTPAGSLSIDASSGELTVADATLFDFETNPTVTGTIAVVDAESTATVTINLNNISELSIQDFSTTMNENPTDGQTVGTLEANGDGTLSFSITSEMPTGAFSIDATTGELTVADPTLFDFETYPVITATISVDNSISSTSATATINLNDLDEISFQDLTTDIDENPTNGQVVETLQASSNEPLSFTITYQSTAGALSIDQSTGELSVADDTLFDFETNPTMFATISVANSVYSVSASATINIKNINEIGDFKYGGVIFWLDPATNNSGGLVCAVSDQSNNIGASWGSNTPTIGNVATAIGTGQANTNAILAVHTQGTNAAKLCNSYTANGYSDWYLPSKDELNEMFINKSIIQTTSAANGGANFKNSAYWTSSEHNNDPTRALNQFFNYGAQLDNQKAAIMHVRAIRTFTDN